MPTVSVIIVNYNGIHLLKDCLESLREQTYKDFETILVDNASTDGSLEFVRRVYPGVRIVANSVNKGYGGGNNNGIRIAEGKYIAVLNNDTKVDRDWLKNLVSAVEVDSSIGMCASKILNYHNPDIIDNTGMLMYRDGLARGRGRLERDLGQYDRQEEVFFPSGCAALYRKEMFDDIGLFDEDFFLYLDDVDIGLRGRLAGWRCIYVPEAVVYHRYSATTEPYSPLKAFLVERNRIWIVIKYFPFSLILVNPFYTLLRYLYQFYGLLAGRGAGSQMMRRESPLQMFLVLTKAYASALRGFGKMIKKRRMLKAIKRVNDSDIYQWLQKFGMTVKEIALKD
jgi:GT2 family glycosyltransferase